jgi:serine/threonine protein kinase
MNANNAARDERADRNLLFGVLALQMDFIRREDLIAATSAWVLDKSQGLDQILLERQALTADEHALLVALVAKHLAKHNDDPQQSLAAVSSVGSVRDELRKLGDPQLEVSLAIVAKNAPAGDPYATQLPSTCDWGGAGLRFRVLRPHARGGLGEVFVAQDLELHREVALKEIQSRFADQPDSRSRFVLEAEITGGLEHPGIVPVYGLGQYADGRPFYAMRFIRGDSLKDAIERFHKADVSGRDAGERSLELRKLLGRFIDVCEAIEYAHSRGILHRDLKPGNVMLGKYGETLVVDWGLAKSVGRGERTSESGETTLQPASGDSVDPTIMGKAIGTPAYMSPEQAAGRLNELGPASDVYSLGATLYSLLTGRPPFSGTDHGAILRQVQQGDFPRPREVKPQAPAALQAICLRAMALKPADRFASPKLLSDDIEHWLADEPISAWRESLWLKMSRFSRRHRAWLSAAFVFLVLASVTATAAAFVINHFRLQEHAIRSVVEEMAREVQLAEARSRSTTLDKLQPLKPGAKELQIKDAKKQIALLDARLTESLDPATRAWLHMRKGQLVRDFGVGERPELLLAREDFSRAATLFRQSVEGVRSEENIESLLASLQSLAEVAQSLGNQAEFQSTVEEALTVVVAEIRSGNSEPRWELWLNRFNAMKAPSAVAHSQHDLGGGRTQLPTAEESEHYWSAQCKSMEELARLPWPTDPVGKELRLESIRAAFDFLFHPDRTANQELANRTAKAALSLAHQLPEQADLSDPNVTFELVQTLQLILGIASDSDRSDEIFALQQAIIDKLPVENITFEHVKKHLDAISVAVDGAWQHGRREQSLAFSRQAVEVARKARDVPGDAVIVRATEFDQLARLANLLEEAGHVDELKGVEKKIVELGAQLQGTSGASAARMRQWERHRARQAGDGLKPDKDPFKL